MIKEKEPLTRKLSISKFPKTYHSKKNCTKTNNYFLDAVQATLNHPKGDLQFQET